MNAKNIQDYVVNRVIHYLEEKDKRLEKLKKDGLVEQCFHCKSEIYIGKNNNYKLHKKERFRRCSGYNCSTPCKFIICGKCAGDFIVWDPESRQMPDYSGVYNWTGNPWLGVHPRPIEDDDYVCDSDCPSLKSSLQ